jgi:hypothetical protein
LAVSNPLATAELPSPFGSIQLKDGASIQVGASFRLFGDYELRVRKISPTTVRLGYFKQRGKEWKTTVSVSAGVAATVGGGDDLFGQILSALTPDPDAEFQELKGANVDETTISSIEATIQAAVERTLEIATSLEVGDMQASQAAFLYEIDLSAQDANSQAYVDTALRGDLSKLESSGADLPRGVKAVHSIFTNLRQRKQTFKVNVLGIYNYLSITKLTLKGQVLFDPDTGDLVLSDSATASQLQVAVLNAGKPNAANPSQVRRILASSLLITAAYRASDALVTPPNLKSSHTYCEVHEQTDRETMANELGVAVGLRLMTRDECNAMLNGVTDFGRTLAYASADYNDSLATALFLQNGAPREQTEYEDIGRQAMQLVAGIAGGSGNPVRLRPLQNDDLWRQMKGQGQAKFRTLLPDASALQIGAITADYSTIMWWAKTMNETGQALVKVKNFLLRNPGVSPNDGTFQKLRSGLAQQLKSVGADMREEFGHPWGLIAMDLLIGSRSEARVTFAGAKVNLMRARPIAVGAGRQMV